jgi:hypothetical protein
LPADDGAARVQGAQQQQQRAKGVRPEFSVIPHGFHLAKISVSLSQGKHRRRAICFN